MRKISIIGTGYVGLVTGVCFADLGNHVYCIDIDKEKIEKLKQNIMPIYEPGLEEMVRRNVAAERLAFTTDYAEGVESSDFVFIAVGTPSGSEGEADLSYVKDAAMQIAQNLQHDAIIINKSTVPIGTGDMVMQIAEKHAPPEVKVAVVSNPEFLREGSAISDCLYPDRIVLGSTDREAAERVAQLYLSLRAPIIITDLRTAEMIKYASNAFLATRISFINEIANICERLGADVKEVALGMGYDKRIGHAFLDAGLGWGGSCFPKDVKALEHMASMHGTHPQLLRSTMDINRDQRRHALLKLRELLGSVNDKTVGVLGLSFKPNTDDMREAPSVEMIHLLENEGAHIKAYDPAAMGTARELIPNTELCESAYDVARGSDALLIVTEWNEFKHLDKAKLKELMRQPIVVDGRNIWDPAEMRAMGFQYRGVGRGENPVI